MPRKAPSNGREKFWRKGLAAPSDACIFKDGRCGGMAQRCSECVVYEVDGVFVPTHYMEFLWAVSHPEERAVGIRDKNQTMAKREFASKFAARMRGE